MFLRHKSKKTRFIFYRSCLFFIVIFKSRMSVFLLEGCLKVRFTILAGTVHYLGRYGYPMKKVATG